MSNLELVQEELRQRIITVAKQVARERDQQAEYLQALERTTRNRVEAETILEQLQEAYSTLFDGEEIDVADIQGHKYNTLFDGNFSIYNPWGTRYTVNMSNGGKETTWTITHTPDNDSST